MSENTKISLLEDISDGKNEAIGEFTACYSNFLAALLRKGLLYGGFRICSLSYPHEDKNIVVDRLLPLLYEVCKNFATMKLNPAFVKEYKEKVEQCSQDPQTKKHSVRTMLQYTFLNRLKKRAQEFDVICVTKNNGDVELYSQGSNAPLDPVPYEEEELHALLRKFRIALTRLADKGNTQVYPTGYECYCLKYGCMDRTPYIKKFIKDKKTQAKLEKSKILSDEDLVLILTPYYAQKKKKASCTRKTINNRVRDYRKLLKTVLLDCCPELVEQPELTDKILKASSSIPEHELLPVFQAFLQNFVNEKQAKSSMQTRTVEL